MDVTTVTAGHPGRPERPRWQSGRGQDGEDRPSGGAEDGEEVSVSGPLTALLFLLRAAGHVGGGGWRRLLYATLLFAFITVGEVRTIRFFFQRGIKDLDRGNGFFEVAFATTFFGLGIALIWLPQLITYVSGRTRSGELFKLALQTMQEANRFSSYPVQRKRNSHRLLVMLVIFIALFTIFLLYYIHVHEVVETCSTSFELCATSLIFTLQSTIVSSSFVLIPIKYSILCGLLASGLETVNAELKRMVEDRMAPDCGKLRSVRLFQARLSHSLLTTTDRLSPELITSMFSGIILQVMTYLFLFHVVKSGAFTTQLPTLLVITIPGFSAVLPPCIMGQTILDLSSTTRHLLLALEPDGSETGRQVSAFLSAVERDLDTQCDLRFFRLRLGSLLEMTATILTYVIVMMQFHMSE